MIPLAQRFWAKVNKTSDCWYWTAAKVGRGYGILFIAREGKRQRSINVHRLAWILAYGPIPDGLWVLHRCDHPACVRPDHLYLGTHADNMRDMSVRKRQVFQLHPERIPSGERNGRAKLDARQIDQIRALYATGGIYQYQLARRFGVSQSQIHRITSEKAWAQKSLS